MLERISFILLAFFDVFAFYLALGDLVSGGFSNL